jgi:hypothetical protein
MTEGGRTYAIAIALVVFFVTWATVSARPWASPTQDPRLAALGEREARLRADAKVVSAIVDRRWDAYRAALQKRRVQIAQVETRPIASTQAPAVRIVTLPALTVTRTS